ncbi:MAG: hypothetical protein IJJ70_07690 [Treponema sp.]|nr:hypothetical protein [Treponema sp.]MBQ6056433.1 hypothetical protein [Treponema sp.]MBR0487563.1 hypothetical protein [Treponema sp.]
MVENKHGGVREGAGRPKGALKEGEHKDKRIVIVCTPTEYDTIKHKAGEQGKTVTKYLLDLGLKV